MKSENRCRVLAELIVNILEEGIRLSDAAMHYIDSTFLNPSFKDLEGLLCENDTCDAQSLVQLIFFPDEAFQVRLEEFLEKENFQQRDEKVVVEHIDRNPPITTLYFTDTRGTLKLPMPRSCTGPFVMRLRISNRPDPKLAETIERCIPDKFKNHAKVKLRNARFRQTGSRTAFLCSFFEKITAQSDDFHDVFACLGVVFDIFYENQDDPDIFNGLSNKKKFYFKSLQTANALERRLAATNVETMVLQGKSLPYIDAADAKKKMQLIDRISRAVYGKTIYLEPVYGRIDFGGQHSAQDLDTLIRMLF